MPKPLISTDPNPPKDVRFAHFGVLDTGKSSKGAAITSITINVVIILLLIVVGAVVKTKVDTQKKLVALTLAAKPVEQPKPKPPPPPLPKPPKIEPPKIEPPKIKLPEPIKPPPDLKPVIMPTPKPVIMPAPAPLKITPPPAPVSVALKPSAASIANHDAHPAPVSLGHTEIKALTGPAVAKVNLGGGVPGMPPGAGHGPAATSVHLGSGAPASTDLAGKGAGPVVVKGLATGVQGGTGKGAQGPQQVQLQVAKAAELPRPVTPAPTAAKPTLTLLYKPEPVYSAEAKAAHIEGTVTLHIRVLPTGAVEVLGVVKGLGHGLDEAATTATRNTRFKPPIDATGHPTDVETNVVIRFQLAG